MLIRKMMMILVITMNLFGPEPHLLGTDGATGRDGRLLMIMVMMMVVGMVMMMMTLVNLLRP